MSSKPLPPSLAPPPKKKPHKEKKEKKGKAKERSNIPDTRFYVSTEIPECSKYLRRRDDDDDADAYNNSSSNSEGSTTGNDARSLIRSSEHQHNRRRKLLGAKEVLDEDTYNATLSHIITRNFYPDLPALRALTGGDNRADEAEAEAGNNDGGDLLRRAKPVRGASDLSMSEFFRRYKSEDDHSYDLLTEREDRHDAKKKRWLLATEAENQALRIEAATHPERGLLIPWKYEKRNALFYTPGSAPLTLEEREDLGLIAGTDGDAPLSGSISLAATRFQDGPGEGCGAEGATKEVTLKQPITRKDMLYNRIGLVNPDRIQKAEEGVRLAAKFVATPSPAVGPGGTSPPVTWGKVVGAPVALKRLRTPVEATPGPLFALPEVSRREEIGNTLAEKANKAMRARKNAVAKGPAGLPGKGGGRRRMGSCSPAMQSIVERINQKRWAGKGMDAADSQLRAFYSPSPAGAGLPKMLTKVKEEPKD